MIVLLLHLFMWLAALVAVGFGMLLVVEALFGFKGSTKKARKARAARLNPTTIVELAHHNLTANEQREITAGSTLSNILESNNKLKEGQIITNLPEYVDQWHRTHGSMEQHYRKKHPHDSRYCDDCRDILLIRDGIEDLLTENDTLDRVALDTELKPELMLERLRAEKRISKEVRGILNGDTHH